jgi:vacuolar protein sorting-associated protein 8
VLPQLRNAYVALLCEVDPASAIPSLRYLSPPEYLEWDEALRICIEHEVFDAVVWALDWHTVDVQTF